MDATPEEYAVRPDQGGYIVERQYWGQEDGRLVVLTTEPLEWFQTYREADAKRVEYRDI